MLAEGALWNCGVFAFRLEYLLGVMRDYVDAHCFEDVFDGYSKLPKNSFDYAVVEKAPSVAVVPYSGRVERPGNMEHALARRWPTSIPAALQ